MRKLPTPRLLSNARRPLGGRAVPSHCGRSMMLDRSKSPWRWQCSGCTFTRAFNPGTSGGDEGPQAA